MNGLGANLERHLVREDGSLARGAVEYGRLVGMEDESRPRKWGARVEQGTPERSGVNPVLEMVEMLKTFRVLETNSETVRLQDAALDTRLIFNENVSARASRGTLGPRLL